MGGWHLAQVNIAIPREPLDSPALADFVALLDPVNALADSSPGFVWRLQDDGGDALRASRALVGLSGGDGAASSRPVARR